MDCGPIDLPGPMGESNTLRLIPRGVVLCLGPTAEVALAQAVRALGVGCSAVVCSPGAAAALGGLAAAGLLVAPVDAGPPQTLDARSFDAVAWDGLPAPLRALLAGREGPITPLIAAADPAEAFCHERVVIVDTTAAGGDAALLARAG